MFQKKIKSFFIILFLSIIFNVNGTDYCSANSDKMYVQPGTVYVAPDGLFLNIEGELVGITSVQVDE